MKFARSKAVVVLMLLGGLLLLAALPALANKSVSTSDGLTLTLTDTGTFYSLSVDGNTVPTLAGVSGGFFIVPMDGQTMDVNRHTYYAGTQITGTATQSGSDIHLTTSAVQNQTFDIWLRGGLPYIKVGDQHHRQRRRSRLPARLPPAGGCQRLEMGHRVCSEIRPLIPVRRRTGTSTPR